MVDVENGKVDLAKALADGGPKGLTEALRRLPIALVGKTTCAYSLEANAALGQAAASFGGADAVSTFWVDKMPDGAAIWDALKGELQQKTVPYVFINGEFVGGCDDTKKLQASGALASKLSAAAAEHGLGMATKAAPAAPANTKASEKAPAASAGGTNGCANGHAAAAKGAGGEHAPLLPDAAMVDLHLKPALGDASPKAYPCLFYFPEVVDANAVRLTAIQVTIICCLGIAFRTHEWAHWMILGLALENLCRFMFGPGPSPLAKLAACGAALLTPSFRPGVPKQFASLCGTFMATMATIFLFVSGWDPEQILPSCFLGIYAALAFLEASIDFCMGCVMFGWMVRLGLLPPEAYAVGIATKPEAEYTYEEAMKVVDLPEPQQIRVCYPGKPPSAIDIRYKTKSNDADRQSFNILKHVKILQFSLVLGLFGLAVLWRAAAMPSLGGAAGFSIPNTTGDVLTIMAVVAYGLLGMLYLAKCFKYPRKISKEWFCPLRSNAFVIPPACLVLLASATTGRFDNSTTLAKVLFWIGAPLTLALALYLAARWITDPHSKEHLNAAWLLPPTACFVCALVAPFLDARYTEAAFLWFAFAVALAVPLFVISFQRSLLFQDPDDRNRLLKWTWVAAAAVACAAQVALGAATTGDAFAAALAAGQPLPFSFVSRLLYFIALSLGLMLGLLFLTGHTSRLKFDISTWTLAFPLEALAIATIMYAASIQGDLPRGMAYAGLAVASTAVVVLSLHTIQALLLGGIFVSDAKYGPLSQQILTHEAFRAAGERLKAAVGSLGLTKSGAINGPALADFALQFRRYRLAHAWHAQQEESVIFKEFETYAPGLCARQHEEHARDEELMARWAGLVESLEAAAAAGAGAGTAANAPDGSSSPAATTSAGLAPAEALDALRSEIPTFLEEFEAHLRGEEEHLQRGGRKQLNLDLQKGMLRAMWDATPPEVWAEFLPYVVQNLPMHAQRVKFVRCWAVWALPERAQLIGRMVALGVEPTVWVRLVQSVPEIAPRGAPGWRKYF